MLFRERELHRAGRRRLQGNALIPVGVTTLLMLVTAGEAQAQTNLLTNNAGFETAGSYGHGNGVSNVAPGWESQHYSYAWQGVADGSASEGNRKFFIPRGGRITTASAARANVTAGRVYEMSFDSKKTRDDNTGLWEGAIPSIFFYDANGNRIKASMGAEVQHSGTAAWQNFKVKATAPAGAVKAGVQVDITRGGWPNEDTHDFELDNFKLYYVPESTDTAFARQAPLLVEPNKTAKLKIRYNAKAARDVLVRLMNGATSYGEVRRDANEGRGVLNVDYAVPSNAPASTQYSWEFRIVADGGSWDNFLGKQVVSGVLLDQTVSGSGTIAANHANIQYIGRWKKSDTLNPVAYWGGSQIVTRFNGTSVRVRMSTSNEVVFRAVVDGNEANLIKFSVNGSNQTVTVASGLTDGVHSLLIHKDSEVGNTATFHGFTLDAGKGLLKPAPLPSRRIEFYGDSITSGGSPDPIVANPNRDDDGHYEGNQYRTFAAITARELQAQGHFISKGGTGIHTSFSGLAKLPEYYDLLDWNVWNASTAEKWNYANWQADAVVIGIGHNDQFNGYNEATFITAYRDFIASMHQKYPNAHIFCTNTTMTGRNPMWEKAIVPLLANDPKLHFQLFDPSQGHGGHPRADDHQGMALGNDRWNSLADWIEEFVPPLGAVSGGGSSSGPNLVSNPGFEAEQFGTQTPSGWSEWSSNGGVGSGYTTSGAKVGGNYGGEHSNSAAFNMYTFQTKTGLTNGLYTLRAWVRGSDWSDTWLQAKEFGGTTRTAHFGRDWVWRQVEMKDINVTNGQCEIGIWSNNANTWKKAQFDDVEFFKQ